MGSVLLSPKRVLECVAPVATASALPVVCSPRYDGDVKPKRKLEGWGGDLNSPESVERFRRIAEEYTKKHTISREAARAALVASGILTKSGRLAKRFR